MPEEEGASMSSSKLCMNARFWSIFVVTAIQLLACRLAAAKPSLEFDVRSKVECRDVTPREFSRRHPNQRLVECALIVSTYLVSGNIDEVESISIEISNSEDHLRVCDFSPHTRLESEYAGDIQTTRTRESSRSLTASLGGEVPGSIGGAVANLKPTINGVTGGKEVVTDTMKRVAPRLVVIASGTINDEHGVFFTLRSSSMSSLEGLHEFTIQFVVPADWCSSELQVNCRATGDQKMLWIKRQIIWAQKSAAVTITLAGSTDSTLTGTEISPAKMIEITSLNNSQNPRHRNSE
jgi:hypothetical protein